MEATKAAIRPGLKKLLKGIPDANLDQQSELILRALEPAVDHYTKVACYMDMGRGEVRTMPIISYLFKTGKQVFLPRCTNTRASGHAVLRQGVISHPHLTFHHMLSLAQVQELKPQGKYQLREPALEEPHPLPPELDVVLVPGVAFSLANGARMGHGAGFYDDFIHRTLHTHGKRPLLIGLALKEQILPEVPTEAHDHHMDCIISGDGSVHWFR
ncbi:LAQU0S22e00166g1_1 [Lachancea quebecensis]|uniref:5-formyltetrahydrofolate cyclo-ligase n=1 Tax=Lachancea quebecensis TaxID=1654605 RepID=A0A0P1L3I0_9SACH|nr:LAQU0S22e00166g1_1 [Lachancea quebecensis]